MSHPTWGLCLQAPGLCRGFAGSCSSLGALHFNLASCILWLLLGCRLVERPRDRVEPNNPEAHRGSEEKLPCEEVTPGTQLPKAVALSPKHKLDYPSGLVWPQESQ
jgi:hypothetical protein